MAKMDVADRDIGVTVTLDYDIKGEGTPVVQLHGLTSSRFRDRRLGLDFIEAIDGHRLIRYDARGHGRSTGPAIPAAYVWPRLAGDLLALLNRVAPGERVHAVGKSMGVGTVLHAALRHPERFASLVLVIPPTAWATRLAQHDNYLRNADLIEKRGMDYWASLDRRLPYPPAVNPDRPFTLPDVEERILPSLYRGAAETDLPSPSDLAGLKVPTLILGWIDDPSHPLSTSYKLRDLLPDVRMQVARTPADVRTWSERMAEHITAVEARRPVRAGVTVPRVAVDRKAAERRKPVAAGGNVQELRRRSA